MWRTDPGSGGGSNNSGGSPFDDAGVDETLAVSLVALAVWAVVSALLVAGFIRRERRKAELQRFWTAIHARPDLKCAVEQAAGGGAPFPAPPRHSVLRRFLRATGLAVVVTLGLNLVLLTARPPGSPAQGDGSGGATGSGDGGDTGDADAPFDDPSLDGNPVLSFVFLLLFAASSFLVVRGLCMLCWGRHLTHGFRVESGEGDEEGGGVYAPLPVNVAEGGYPAGVPVAGPPAATAPPAHPPAGESEGEGEEEEQAPPPYSAALAAAPARLV